MDTETIKLILDLGGSAASADEVRAKLEQLRKAGQGVADTYEVLDSKVLRWVDAETRSTAAMDAQVAAAVEATRAHKVMDQTIEELSARTESFGKISRANQLRILEFGRSVQDFAQGGLSGVINKCSTPFGITDKITRPKTHLRSRLVCAQRLSASQTRSQQRPAGAGRRRDVLNAFRHHRQDHDLEGADLRWANLCSTPFGITDKITPPAREDMDAVSMCSTPFGITDKITARGLGRTVIWIDGCSTPFGITDKITSRAA